MLAIEHADSRCFSALRLQMESDDTTQTPSVTGRAPYLTFFPFFFFFGDVISPSEDEAAFNLLPNSPVHQAEMRPLSYVT